MHALTCMRRQAGRRLDRRLALPGWRSGDKTSQLSPIFYFILFTPIKPTYSPRYHGDFPGYLNTHFSPVFCFFFKFAPKWRNDGWDQKQTQTANGSGTSTAKRKKESHYLSNFASISGQNSWNTHWKSHTHGSRREFYSYRLCGKETGKLAVFGSSSKSSPR